MSGPIENWKMPSTKGARVGDLVTFRQWPIRRRWWQFWKPRIRYEDFTYRVVSIYIAAHPWLEGYSRDSQKPSKGVLSRAYARHCHKNGIQSEGAVKQDRAKMHEAIQALFASGWNAYSIAQAFGLNMKTLPRPRDR